MRMILLLSLLIFHLTVAMEKVEKPRWIATIKPLILSILNKKLSLSDTDIKKAELIIKEIRAQSPASALIYEQKLLDRISQDSINTDRITESAQMQKGTITRSVSPLAWPAFP